MKKFLIFFFSFVIVAALVGILLFFLVFNKPKEDILDVGRYTDLTFDLDKSSYSASVKRDEFLSPIGKLVIPQKVLFEKQEYTVTEIADNGFQKCEITGIELPDSIKVIGNSAFEGCSQVTGEVKLPQALTQIGEAAFKDCGMSGNLVLPAGLEILGGHAFENCSKLEGGLNIPAGVTEIKDYTFSGCVNISARLTFHGDLLRIGQNAFKNCEKITELIFAEGLEFIGSGAFYGCKGVKGEVALPSTLTSVNAETFYGCQNVVGFKLPAELQTIEARAFYGCGKLKEIRIGSAVGSIKTGAFEACNSLTDVYIDSQEIFNGLSSSSSFGHLVDNGIRKNIYLSSAIDLSQMTTFLSSNYILQSTMADGYWHLINKQNP